MLDNFLYHIVSKIATAYNLEKTLFDFCTFSTDPLFVRALNKINDVA